MSPPPIARSNSSIPVFTRVRASLVTDPSNTSLPAEPEAMAAAALERAAAEAVVLTLSRTGASSATSELTCPLEHSIRLVGEISPHWVQRN